MTEKKPDAARKEPLRFELRTPAERLPQAPGQGEVIADILERLAWVEDQTGVGRRPRRRHEPLPGSTVQPLDDEDPDGAA